MRNFSKFFAAFAAIMLFAMGSFAQMTTSGINGRITGDDGSLPGATVCHIYFHQLLIWLQQGRCLILRQG